MTICWSPGQKTAIHTHNGQLGWLTVAQDEVTTHEFHHAQCNAPENQNVVNIDCLGSATELQIDCTGSVTCAEGSGMVTVDKLQAIHQIENTGRTGCVSLHVYSKPFDSSTASAAIAASSTISARTESRFRPDPLVSVGAK